MFDQPITHDETAGDSRYKLRLAGLGQASLALQKINRRDLSGKIDTAYFLQQIVQIVSTELSYSDCQLYMVDQSGRYLDFKYACGYLAEEPAQRPGRYSLSQAETGGPVGQAAASFQTVIVSGLKNEGQVTPGPANNSEIAVPLLFEKRLLGVLDVQSRQPAAFDEIDRQILEIFATQLASQLQTCWPPSQVEPDREDNTALLEIGQAILRNLLTISGASSGNLFLLAETLPHRLQSLTNYNLPAPLWNSINDESWIVRQVLSYRRPFYVEDMNEYLANSPEIPVVVENLRQARLGASVGLLLYAKEEVLGLLFLNYEQAHHFSDSEKERLETAATEAGSALYQSRFNSRQQINRRLAESLAHGSRLLSALVETQAVLETIADEVIETLQVPACGIFLIEDGRQHFTRAVTRGCSPETRENLLEMGKGFVGTVAKTGQMWKEYDITLLPQFAHSTLYQRENWHGSLALPIKTGSPAQEVIGVLACFDRLPREFSRAEIVYLEGLAGQAAISVSNARMFQVLKRERDMYQALLENANDAIFLVNPQNCEILDANQQAGKSTGYEYNELVGRSIESLYPPEEQHKINKLCQQIEVNTMLVENNIQLLRKDGTRLPVSYSARSVQIGQERIIIQIVRDMTERWLMEQQLIRSEQLRALGQLASGVAHDFNNLLMGILGVSELLLKNLHNQEEQRLLSMLRQSALDGAQMVRRIQLLSPGRNTEIESVNLNPLLQDVIQLTRPRWHTTAQQHGITIDVRLETEEIPPVKGNSAELREVLTNLILNAVDAMPQGGRLTLRTAYRRNEVWLSVEDTGVGISEETRNHLFEPFYTTKSRDGHGLGLSVSNSIIARHNGTIEVQSKIGWGSRFTIKLPASQPIAAPTELEKPVEITPRRVLVVDDEPNLLYILTRFLEADLHTVTAATSGLEAVRLFNEHPANFDLVFTDLSIQDLNGWEIARAIQEKRPDLPIVLVTGWGGDLKPATLENHHIAHLLHKPYRYDDVQKIIRKIFNPEPGAEAK